MPSATYHDNKSANLSSHDDEIKEIPVSTAEAKANKEPGAEQGYLEAWHEENYRGDRYSYTHLGSDCYHDLNDSLRSAKNQTDYGIYFFPDYHCDRTSDSVYIDSGGEHRDFGFDAWSFRREDQQ
jgi:hypothetical protein